MFYFFQGYQVVNNTAAVDRALFERKARRQIDMIHGRGSSWHVSLVINTSTIKSRPVLCSRLQANNNCQFRKFVGPIRGPVRKHSPGRIEKISGPVSKGTGNRVKYDYTRVSCCEAYVQAAIIWYPRQYGWARIQ